MDYQHIYYAAGKLLHQKGITQKTISKKLAEMKITGYSEGNLSRAKPRYNRSKKQWRRGALSDGQLRELMKGMVKILQEKGVEMKTEAGHATFYDVNTKEKYDIPPLQYEEEALNGEKDEETEETLTEKINKKEQLQLLQTVLLKEGPLADALANHIEKGGQVEIIVINLSGGQAAGLNK